MKTTSTQQEIFLIKNSNYLCREWAETKELPNTGNAAEKLGEACWNGLIKELLPEIFRADAGQEPVYLWQVRNSPHFLELAIGNVPAEPIAAFSLDPHLFLSFEENLS